MEETKVVINQELVDRFNAKEDDLSEKVNELLEEYLNENYPEDEDGE
jgi:hypothetical protein